MSTLSTTNLKNPSSGSNNIVLATDGATTLTTAKITTLADSAGGNTSTPAAIANGIAKAWVNFNGTGTIAIRSSYNVSSITDNNVGDYTVNFTTALTDANYAVCGAQGGDADVGRVCIEITLLAAGSARMNQQSATTPGTLLDATTITYAFFR